jgi:hypothetical protein
MMVMVRHDHVHGDVHGMFVMFMFVMMLMIVLMAGDPRLAASAYATHINLPRCR